MRALGARVERTGDGTWRVHGVGVGGFTQPGGALDFGNSGTGCRLAIGAVAGAPVTATFSGDDSLSSRPMQRVLDPLLKMGARVLQVADGGRLPLTLQGAADPIPIVYELPVPRRSSNRRCCSLALAAPGRDDGDRSGSNARPHRTIAETFRRENHAANLTANMAVELSCRVNRSLSRRMFWCQPILPLPPFLWSLR